MLSTDSGAVRLCNSKKEQEVLDNYSGTGQHTAHSLSSVGQAVCLLDSMRPILTISAVDCRSVCDLQDHRKA